ncbi:MAG: DUF1727 domain-containing protein [Cyanobacteria bacterium QS_8_64_29]|nr:MAG: DUF1727 domain-containing protein [Cyanobacteria bacterium QS_8_64_29]
MPHPAAIAARLRLALTAGVAKASALAVRQLRLGAASVLPGEIAQRLQPHVLARLGERLPQGAVLVVGTNGKTTTALLLRRILEAQGQRVAHNASGANLPNGLTAALLAQVTLTGRLQADCAILEVDENALPRVLDSVAPRFVLGLNLFRDQLDRYGEVDAIAQRWQRALAALSPPTTVVLNADDPTLCQLGQQFPQAVQFFGLSEPQLYLEQMPHAVDAIDCPRCGTSLAYRGVYISHLGDFYCPSCHFARSEPALDSREWPQILIGVYNKYNTLAAGTVARAMGIPQDRIFEVVRQFRAAFGRAEELQVEGKQVRILLSKNPVGANETIRAILERQAAGETETTLLVLNDRTPDGTDVSWIWDVDADKLVAAAGVLVVSGDRAYDMALRLAYGREALSEGAQLLVEPDLRAAIATALAQTPRERTLHIVPTYSAMLEVRQVLTGRQIL